MKASLGIEAIGHDTVSYARMVSKIFADAGAGALAPAVFGRPLEYARWCVLEVDSDGRPIRRVRGTTDYTRANSKGSRGVYKWYLLESGHRYYVRAPESWRAVDEYFCHVSDNGEIIRE